MSSESFLSYSGNITDAFLSGGNVNAWKCCGDVHRLCSKHDFKWRHLRRLMYIFIYCERILRMVNDLSIELDDQRSITGDKFPVLDLGVPILHLFVDETR